MQEGCTEKLVSFIGKFCHVAVLVLLREIGEVNGNFGGEFEINPFRFRWELLFSRIVISVFGFAAT